MVKNKKWILITWLLTLVFIICAFLPMLKFSFNSSAVNIFGVCEEFAATYQKYHRDFAPVGYLSLDQQGRILEVNLTGSALLGVERSRLVNRSLSRFVILPGRTAFLDFSTA